MRPCTLIGNVGAQPELRYTPNGKAVCTFSLATYDGKDQQGTELTTWVRVSCWTELAETVNKKVGKGDRLQVEGILDRPYLYKRKDDKGQVLLDDFKLPIWDAQYQMTAFAVQALDYRQVDLDTLPDIVLPAAT